MRGEAAFWNTRFDSPLTLFPEMICLIPSVLQLQTKQKKKKRRVTRRQKAGHKSSSGRELAVATPAIFYTPMWFTNLSCLFRISRRYVWRYYSLLSLSLNKLGKYYPKTSQAKAVCLHRSLSSLKGLKHWGRTEEGGGARTCGFLHNFSCT